MTAPCGGFKARWGCGDGVLTCSLVDGHSGEHIFSVVCRGAYGKDGCGWTGGHEELVAGCCPVCRGGHLTSVLAVPDSGEYPCRFCNGPTTRLGGFCSRNCEKDWSDGRLDSGYE